MLKLVLETCILQEKVKIIIRFGLKLTTYRVSQEKTSLSEISCGKYYSVVFHICKKDPPYLNIIL